jgi:hypothetical protein
MITLLCYDFMLCLQILETIGQINQHVVLKLCPNVTSNDYSNSNFNHYIMPFQLCLASFGTLWIPTMHFTIQFHCHHVKCSMFINHNAYQPKWYPKNVQSHLNVSIHCYDCLLWCSTFHGLAFRMALNTFDLDICVNLLLKWRFVTVCCIFAQSPFMYVQQPCVCQVLFNIMIKLMLSSSWWQCISQCDHFMPCFSIFNSNFFEHDMHDKWNSFWNGMWYNMFLNMLC